MTTEPLPDPLPAPARQGEPGHDDATEMMSGTRLITLKSNGLTYEQIAEEAGYTDKSSARRAVLRALDRHEAENASQLRALENIAYAADTRVLRAIIMDSAQPVTARLRAIDVRTRLSARHARLNGLDAPVQVAISAGVQSDLTDALAELEATVRPLYALPAPAPEVGTG